MIEELKPCPFCGSEAHIDKVNVRIHKAQLKGRRTKQTSLMYMIGCSDPDCILYSTRQKKKLLFAASRFGLDTMIRRWNRRVTE